MRNEPPWSPEDHDLQIADAWLCLVCGIDDGVGWSEDVRAALRAHRGFLRRFAEQAQANPDADEQLQIGADVALRSITRIVAANPTASAEDREAFLESTFTRAERAMRFVADRQVRRRTSLVKTGAGRGAVAPLRSVIDGWNWRGGGRPSRAPVTGLLLRVEIWRDVRARVRPDVGRVPRGRALAEVLVYDLRKADPALHALIEQRRKHYAEEDTTRDALVRAVTRLNGAQFSKLRVQFAQVLKAAAARLPERALR